MDITFFPIFLWALFWGSLAAGISNLLLQIFSTFMAPLQFVAILWIAYHSKSMILANDIISENIMINGLIAFFILPFIFFVFRGYWLYKKKRLGHSIIHATAYRKRTLWMKISLIAMCLLVSSINTAYTTTSSNKNTITKLEIFDDPRFMVQVQSTRFLDQRVLSLTLKAVEDPLYFALSMESSTQDLVIYDAPMPFIRKDEHHGDFVLGTYPPNPFSVEITIPAEMEGTITARAGYRHKTTTQDTLLVEEVLVRNVAF
jgi:hypothetical protein